MQIGKRFTTSCLALAIASSAVWAETPKVAQRADVTLAMANQLLHALPAGR